MTAVIARRRPSAGAFSCASGPGSGGAGGTPGAGGGGARTLVDIGGMPSLGVRARVWSALTACICFVTARESGSVRLRNRAPLGQVVQRMTDEHWVATEASPKRVRAVFAGHTIADSNRVLMLREAKHTPVYYFPMDDVRMDLLVPSAHRTTCPFKGEASYWSVEVDGRRADDAVWGYEDPIPERADIKGHVAFYWDKLDHWFEEEDEVFVHPRDPYHRVDVLHSARHLRVVVGGETVAESTRPVLLFETGLPVRYYLPKLDVRLDLPTPTDTITHCPY